MPSKMASKVATRRSPRSIERICNGIVIPRLSNEQTATFLSLAHCTGWSADQIAYKVAEATDARLTAEEVWDYHWFWVWVRDDGEEVSIDDWSIMQLLMRGIGVCLAKPGRPLSRTAKPTTVKFAESWNAKHAEGQSLVTGCTAHARQESKAYLLLQKSQNAYGRLTPMEEIVLRKFGSTMTGIMGGVLKRWARAMLFKLREDPGVRPIRERDHVKLIMEYLKLFQDYYEEKFGMMEDGKPSALGEIRDTTVYIRSTGYGAKVLLGLLMADRLHVVDKKRKQEREKMGFADLDVSELESDSKDCLICQDPMGVPNETPIKLVICCNQLLGAECLRVWLRELIYGDAFRDTCPVCRFKFPDTFLAKLFSKEEYEARRSKEMEMFSLVSPALPTPGLATRVGGTASRPVVIEMFDREERGGNEEDELTDDDFDMEG